MLKAISSNILTFILSIIVVAFILMIGFDYIPDEYRNFQSVNFNHNKLMDISNQVAKFDGAKQEKLRNRIQEIKNKIYKNQVRQSHLSFIKSLPVGNDYFENNKLEIENYYLQQELSILIKLEVLSGGSLRLEDLRKLHVIAFNKLKSYDKQHPVEAFYKSQTHTYLYNQDQMAEKNFKEYKATMNSFVIKRNQIDSALKSTFIQIKNQEKAITKNLIGKFYRFRDIFIPKAFKFVIQGILMLSVIMGVIKVIFYYVLAPLASRRPAICILPKVSGTIENVTENLKVGFLPTKVSATSIQLNLDKGQELLIHPEYIQSSTIASNKDTKWLLSYSLPLSSFLSGMVALTRIYTNSSESVVISSTKDPLIELGILSLPEGSAIVLKPCYLVGVLHDKNYPIKITRHWRLNSVHAWLTLQLRYLVFHGPVKLIVKGCRGIRVEKAGLGRRVSQAATIGFSANLQYSTTRCETFFPYLSAKHKLLNDGFIGNSGFYIYEETPRYGSEGNILNRGLQGVVDAFLKIFGIG